MSHYGGAKSWGESLNEYRRDKTVPKYEVRRVALAKAPKAEEPPVQPSGSGSREAVRRMNRAYDRELRTGNRIDPASGARRDSHHTSKAKVAAPKPYKPYDTRATFNPVTGHDYAADAPVPKERRPAPSAKDKAPSVRHYKSRSSAATDNIDFSPAQRVGGGRTVPGLRGGEDTSFWSTGPPG
ncbi:hypothetical protein KIPB_005148 [Kipferlia bialata]|uniref:Uncharacterized protein n=1 Tax=Kipferlia bialata TaxID=797122 RepID=A0A9K3CVL8_9EUKA|nr:hypothetical protein KIPB_005148 [Kipferlia bialata]|eukprot:g5148.t1